MFIELKIDKEKCARCPSCQVCVQACPVDVFKAEGGMATVVESEQDECTLCDLCHTKCPTKAIKLVKLY
ncbi:MAG: 4Fe-4S binding protein [Chloroflexi bacterium]|nr:4Fe-4S binding protein [Chloroflexota bacterium]